MNNSHVTLIPLEDDDREQFIRDNQESFLFGATQEFGVRDEHFEEDGQIISRATIEASIDGEHVEAYRIWANGEKAGGLVLSIDPKTLRGELDLLFVSPHTHSRGVGQAAWWCVEALHPEVRVWELVTPYFERRNIHFYVNKLGFHIASFAKATGLAEGIPLVSAGGDQQCGALGQGVVGSGRIAATFGTGAFLLEQVDEIPEEMHGELICGAHALPGAYTLESSMLTCGALFDWCRRTLFPEGLEVMNDAVAASPVGAGGVSALPFFQGRGTPDWNSAAHGAFAGLSLSTTRGDLARAALEAIALEAANHVELLEAQGGRAAAICVGGGLTNQPLFPQMLADASGRTVLREQDAVEGTARGAWMSAAVTLGLVSDFEEAFTVAASRSAYDPYKPNEATAVRYQELRTRMNELYLQTK